MIMDILTIINTVFIVYLLVTKNNRYYFTFNKRYTSGKTFLTGVDLILWKRSKEYSSYVAEGVFIIRVPIRNHEKSQLKEDIIELMKPNNPNKIQSLSAMFSWLKTKEEVEQFQKDYSVVDPEYVQKLVNEWKIKNKQTGEKL